MFIRRKFLKMGVVAGAGLFVPWEGIGLRTSPGGNVSRAFAAIAGGTPDATTIPKYVMPLIIPPAMPRTSTIVQRGSGPIDYYEIAVRQFQQQILPDGMPMTTVWSYGSVNHPGTFNYPAFTIEANFNRSVRVKWINDLKDANGDFLPHILPVDPTLHWANPPGSTAGRDMRPTFASTPGPYTGPGPIVNHLHGGRNRPPPRRGGRPVRTVLRDPDRDPGPLLQRRRLALLPGQSRVLRRFRRALHPRERRPAHLEPGVLRQQHGRQRSHLALPRCRAAAG